METKWSRRGKDATDTASALLFAPVMGANRSASPAVTYGAQVQILPNSISRVLHDVMPLQCFLTCPILSFIFILEFVSGIAAIPNDVVKRQEPSQNQYAPSAITCPQSRPTIASADKLSPNESSWLPVRQNNTIPALRDFLARANLSGFDTNAYIDSHAGSSGSLPTIGIAVSGGGWRALMNGAGVLAAFDNRTSNATAKGHMGGLLQAATYLSGLSGGGWLLGSLYYNNFTPVQGYLNGTNGLGSLWQFDDTILGGPKGLRISQYFEELSDSVDAKEAAGFNVTLSDYWGRALSYQLFDASNGRPDFHFSSIAQSSILTSGNAPLPLLVADQRAPNQLLISGNATNFEFNPWEFGSYDSSTNAYGPVQYVGSNFNGGTAQSCVQGFDNIGFVVGTSSSLFNQFYLNLNDTDINQTIKSILNSVLGRIGASNADISVWPNPFFGFNNGTASNAAVKNLTLVDGGEDLQNIPLHPLLRAPRNVDIIFAVDSSADTSNWPNGTAMVATYERFASGIDHGASGFPSIPDQNTFINLGLNNRPSFFGCDAANQSASTPLVVYIPNSPVTYHSNISTFAFSVSDGERNSIITNGYGVATRGNGTLDKQWPACAGCAILARSLQRTGTTVPQICAQCFNRYCWNGTVNSTTPNNYEPTLTAKASGGSRAPFRHSFGLFTLVACLALVW